MLKSLPGKKKSPFRNFNGDFYPTLKLTNLEKSLLPDLDLSNDAHLLRHRFDG